MTSSANCPRCGSPRTGDRFCGKCGVDFWQLAAGTTASPVAKEPRAATESAHADVGRDASPLRQYALIAGIAWLIAAAAIAYLAFLQLQYSSTGFVGSSDAGGLAFINGASAIIFGFIGAKAVGGRATKAEFLGAAFWAAINIAWAVLQISQGVTHPAYLLGTVAIGVAGIVSFSAWRQAPDDGSRSMTSRARLMLALVVIGVVIAVLMYVVQRV